MAKENTSGPTTVQPEKIKAEPLSQIVELELKPGEAIVSLSSNDDESKYFKTSLSDWIKVFSKQKQEDGTTDKYKLIKEKKS